MGLQFAAMYQNGTSGGRKWRMVLAEVVGGGLGQSCLVGRSDGCMSLAESGGGFLDCRWLLKGAGCRQF